MGTIKQSIKITIGNRLAKRNLRGSALLNSIDEKSKNRSATRTTRKVTRGR